MTFFSYDALDMLDAVNRAIDLYNDADQWKKLRANAMKMDFSWMNSAVRYLQMYDEVLSF